MPFRHYLVKVLWYYVGFFVCVSGYALVITPNVGPAPWDIFHLGVAGRTGVPLFLVIQVTSLAVILLNIRLGIRPTAGMVLNMLTFGPVLQFLLSVLQRPDTLIGRWAMLVAGILVIGLGTAFYMSSDLGTGPRDGLMIGLTRLLGRPIGVVKNAMDLAIVAIGFLLGGPLGLGTVAVVLGLGPSMQLGMAAVSRLATYPPFTRFVHPVSLKRAAAQ